MTKRGFWSVLVAAIVIVVVLYDVDFVLEIDLSGERTMPDPEVEAAYQRCYESRDDQIHDLAFGTIDNPDVQREFISSNRARATTECRAEHPETMVTVTKPRRFRLFELTPRFW